MDVSSFMHLSGKHCLHSAHIFCIYVGRYVTDACDLGSVEHHSYRPQDTCTAAKSAAVVEVHRMTHIFPQKGGIVSFGRESEDKSPSVEKVEIRASDLDVRKADLQSVH